MSVNEFDQAWNSILLDFPSHRLNFLDEISKKFRIFLFSNTNEIHLQCFQDQFFKRENRYLDDLFEKAYYSHILGMRKPHKEAYQKIIDENNLNPKRTLFFDDSPQHIEGSLQAGLRGHLLAPGVDIVDLFHREFQNSIF